MLGFLKGHRAELAERAKEVYNNFTINSYLSDNQHQLAAAQAVCVPCIKMYVKHAGTWFFNMLLRGGKPAFRVVKSEN